MIDISYHMIHTRTFITKCKKFTYEKLFILIIVKYSILKGVTVVVCLITRSSLCSPWDK